MGFWKSQRGLNGDQWADAFGDCMKELARIPAGEDHEITMQEFADLVEFCSRGHLVVDLRYESDGSRPLSRLHDVGIETYPNRGQIQRLETCEV